MKKRLLVVFVFIACICLCLGLYGCTPDIGEEQGDDGHTHTADHYEYDSVQHWKICTVCSEKFAVGNHNFNKDNVCETCEYSIAPTIELEYELNTDTDTYTVIGIKDTNITKIVIPANYNDKAVTSIGSSAFSGLDSLTNIIIPDSVTSIGEYAFKDCSSLESITVSENVTSIGKNAFENCTSLESVNWNAKTCSCSSTYDDRIFANCTKLATVTIGEQVTTISSYTFSGCVALTSIVWNAEKFTAGGYPTVFIFYGSTNITEITLGAKVQQLPSDLLSVLDECLLLEKITVSPDNQVYSSKDGILYNKEMTEIIYIPKAIKGSVTLPDGITELRGAIFANHASLVGITLPDGMTTIGPNAFANCVSLESINIPDSVTSIGMYALHNTAYYNDPENWDGGNVLYVGKYLVESKKDFSGAYTIRANTKVISGSAFYGCNLLESIIIPNSVTIIGEFAFGNCKLLTSITIPDSVTSIERGAFSGCTAEIVWGENPAITEIGYATFGGYQGTQITIPQSVTSIGSDAFNDCSALESITVSSDNTAFGSQDGILYDKEKTNIIFVPKAIKGSVTIPDSVTSIESFAFVPCVALTSVIFEENSQLSSIGSNAFSNCSSLESITIPDSVTTIGDYAFSDCSSLESIIIPEKVTSIGNYAFV